MDQQLTKELAKKLIKVRGEVRGLTLKTDERFVLKEKGREGVKRVEEELERIGYPIQYSKVKSLDFFPAGLRAISLLAIKKTFGWGDEQITKMGEVAPLNTLIIRLYMKFFHSVDTIAKKAPQIWHEYLTEGELIVKEYDEEKKYAIAQIKNFELDPIFCHYLKGFFTNFVRMIFNATKVECQETKCTFKGDKYHEFLIEW